MKPDITAKIEAIGPDGKTIDDGADISDPGDGAPVALRFVVVNPTAARTGPFWLRPCVRVNGDKAYDPEVEMVNLEPGEAWEHEYDRALGDGPEQWDVTLLADINDFVDESDERNNHARLSFGTRRSS